MDRRDNYDNKVNPGDIICFLFKGQMFAGRVHSISLRGTLTVHPWSDELQGFRASVHRVSGWNLIKVTGVALNNDR